MEKLIHSNAEGQKGTSECMKALFNQDYLDDMTKDRRSPFRGVKPLAGTDTNDIDPNDSYIRQRFILYTCGCTKQSVKEVKWCIKSYLYKRRDHLGFLQILGILTDKGYGSKVPGVNAVRKILRDLKLTPSAGNAVQRCITFITEQQQENGFPPPGADDGDDDM